MFVRLSQVKKVISSIDSLSKRQRIVPPDTTDGVREPRVDVDKPVTTNPTASPPAVADELSLLPAVLDR
jgi:hypothetical protein